MITSIDGLQFRKISNLYKLLQNKFSLQILDLLHTQPELKVGDIYKALNLSQSQTSQQLAKLRKAKIVITKREKTVIFYRINTDRIEELKVFANQILASI